MRLYRGGRSLDRPDVAHASGRDEDYEYVEPEFGFGHEIPLPRGEHELSEDCYCHPARGTEQGKGLVLLHFTR